MGVDSTQKLHWTQRVALVRHNLHAARRTSDFTFFKTLQAHALIDGTDHVAVLHSVLGNDADSVLSTLDNLNAGIAYVHQDAFKSIYDGAKSIMHKDNSPSSRRSLLRVDVCQQRDMADHAIDKTANSAIQLIQAQPIHCQDAVANAWITGTTIIADAVSVCLNEMEFVEDNIDDFIRLEYAWSSIQNSVDAAISALRGIFSLMSNANEPSIPTPSRTMSVSSVAGSAAGSENGGFIQRSRQSSTASALGLIKRAFSHSQLQSPPPQRVSHTGSLPLPEANPRGFRLSMSNACPTKMPTYAGHHPHTLLTTIPHTPAAIETPMGSGLNPFKEINDYFQFDMQKSSADQESAGTTDLMQLESLDPLYSPVDELMKMPEPLTLRRLSQSFGNCPPTPIAA
ncbi:hypothetical protein BDV95DRAFT_624609 [Massariosphaeria phaeospora]|uniref:Uncharacterized protein n=1 Tax=Massariosphaeria phaeospora TaxID=100035 RepID=A0A7C8MVH2_9PLEO|nr:hypothetical protein BDV95DRAFT_624609 [Massariosphaeria phaeospora]